VNLLLFVACAHPTLQVGAADRPPVDAAIVPGCPSLDDGHLSPCQWRRVLWAQHLWASGLTRSFIVSGNAVYNRYVEADALKAGLVALGVPADRIHLEPQALHTDENIAFSLHVADAQGFETLSVASDAIQTTGSCTMIRAWSGHTRGCIAAPMDYPLIRARLAQGLPEVRTEPIPEADWMPLDERERRIAEALHRPKRGPSLWVYLSKSILAPFGLAHPPPLPP
jgi:hypothetical protein